MTVFYEQNARPAGRGADGLRDAERGRRSDDSSIKKIDCQGPVTIVSKTQVATGDNATFDRVANKIFLIGNAALSDGPNVTRGRARSSTTSIPASPTSRPSPGGRVKALFVPGSNARRRQRRPAKATARPSRRSRPRN